MSETQKATFGAEEQKLAEPRPKKEEIAVIWERTDKNEESYLSAKIKFDDQMLDKVFKERELNFKAFKNKMKKGKDAKPDFVAFKDTQKKS